MAARHKQTSPYADTPLVNGAYLGIWTPRFLPPHESDLEHRVESRHAGRPDLLAMHFYGNPNFWWVFMAANMDSVIDPAADLVEGLEIRVPARARVVGGLT